MIICGVIGRECAGLVAVEKEIKVIDVHKVVLISRIMDV